jgi:2-oxoisovalerate dehydrogenase E1 component
VTLASIAARGGSRVIGNDEVIGRFPDHAAADIERRTGIRSRRVLGPGETLVGLATEVSRQALTVAGLEPGDVDAIYVSTGTPPAMSPSLACAVQEVLAGGAPLRSQAVDVSAACSGFLYGLQMSHDYLQQRPEGVVLLVAAEEMSRFIDPDDFDTAILFGDAVGASVVLGPDHGGEGALRAHRPVLAADGSRGAILGHGAGGTGPVRMRGREVYAAAVREMERVLRAACAESGVAVDDLDRVVCHQANSRIISAVQARSGLPPERFVDVMAEWGNTSSASIPVALVSALAGGEMRGGPSAIVAFGAGLTSGAAILEPDA